MVKELWVSKYSPKTIGEYVFRDEQLKRQVDTFIKEKSFGNLLLSGSAGIGKSSLARVLMNEIGVDSGDLLYLNASAKDSRGIDAVSSQIEGFASTIPMGDFKVILLEESDMLTPAAQTALRRPLEDYSDTCRFILTANYVHKIIPAIRSRCQEIVFHNLDQDAFKLKMAEILVAENVNISDEDILDTYMKATYPDLRKCINLMQQNSINGELLVPDDSESSSKDWQINCIELFKKGSITDARKLIVSQIRHEEYEQFFRLCYQNLDWFGKTEEQQDEALLIIRDAVVKDSSVGDREINLSAMLVQLSRIGK